MPLLNLKRNGSVGDHLMISANSYRENKNFSSGFIKAGGVTSNFARYKSIFAVGGDSQLGQREKSFKNSLKSGHMTQELEKDQDYQHLSSEMLL